MPLGLRPDMACNLSDLKPGRLNMSETADRVDRRVWVIAAACTCGPLMSGLDSTMVNVSLDTIGQAFGASLGASVGAPTGATFGAGVSTPTDACVLPNLSLTNADHCRPAASWLPCW